MRPGTTTDCVGPWIRSRAGGVFLAACLLAGRTGDAGETVSAGPLYDRFRLTLEPGDRIEAAGPFWSGERRDEGAHGWALTPLCAWWEDPDGPSRRFEFLYPLATYYQVGDEYRYQFLQCLSLAGGQSQPGQAAERLTVFPFYFQERSADPARDYTAFLPFYGRMQNRLFRDEIQFTLFPLYVRTRKKDVVTRNYALPIFHLREGEGLKGWQFWPLVGREHKDPTTRTNGFGDVEPVGGYDKFFALWPFCSLNRLGVGTTNEATVQAVLPLFTVYRSPARDSATYLWPLGLTLTDDREKGYREIGMPWPLIVFAHGEGKTTRRVWPLFSHAHNAVLESDFYLWPLYKRNRAHAPPLDRERTRILLFLYSDLTEANTETGKARRRTDLWPLFTARKEADGRERLQLLAPLEPLLPGNTPVERLYSPLWSIWRSEKNPRTGASSQSFLWNLYRHERTPSAKKCSLLFGLIQYQSGPEGHSWRWFHIFRGKRKPAPGPSAARGVGPAGGESN